MPEPGNAPALLTALSAPTRLSLLAAVAMREQRGEPVSATAVAGALGISMKALMKDAVRLSECGLLSLENGSLRSHLALLRTEADRLDNQSPISSLLAGDPDVARFFKFGRLVALPVNADMLQRLAAVLIQLLPAETVLSETQVNDLLRQVSADYATLRRLLVDHRLVSRNGAADYRRIA